MPSSYDPLRQSHPDETTTGAKYWLEVLTEIRNRWVADGCIAVRDGLKALPEAINSVRPQTIVQPHVIHLLHNTFRTRPAKTGIR